MEELSQHLNDNRRGEVENETIALRKMTDEEKADFQERREEMERVMSRGNGLQLTDDDENRQQEDNLQSIAESSSEGLRQRQIQLNHPDRSEVYNALEQELRVLYETANEVNRLAASQGSTISRTNQLIQAAHDDVNRGASLLHQTIRHKYTKIASGALLGAALGGPVGLCLGAKAGALVALSSSTVAIVTMKIMQRHGSSTTNSSSMETSVAYDQAML
jgi:hypothetical protein